jgi:Conjugal transfer protein
MRTLPLLLTAGVLAGCAAKPPPVVVMPPPAPPRVVIPDDPFASLRPDVKVAIERGSNETLRDGVTTIYSYSPDTEWTVDCAPMHTVDIHLAPDESTDKESVSLGDPTRWSIKVDSQVVEVEPAGDFGGYIDPVSKQKVPADPHMVTTLTIATSKRRYYHLLLRMRHKSAGAIEWYYAQTVKEQQAARQLALKEAAKEGQQ